MRLLARIVVNAIALLATTLVPGIGFSGTWLQLLIAGAVLGLFNLIVRPIAFLLSLPFLILTLGLFYFVLNGLLLWCAQFVLPGYRVAGLLSAMLGALVMSLVNWALSALVEGKKSRS
jgi:putative membrane protein